MSWLRTAGGFWVDPSGSENAINSHGEWAYKHYLHQFISDEEQTEPEIKDLPLAGPKVEYKGTGGAEAKKMAEEKMKELGIANPLEAANKLMGEGWVRISTDDPSNLIVMAMDYAHMMVAEETIIRAAKSAELVQLFSLNEHDQCYVMPADLSLGLKAAIEKAHVERSAPTQTSGLGSWRMAGEKKPEVQYFKNIVHKPQASVGKQWLITDDNGKTVASGPSRKWAERNARRLGWYRREQQRRSL